MVEYQDLNSTRDKYLERARSEYALKGNSQTPDVGQFFVPGTLNYRLQSVPQGPYEVTPKGEERMIQLGRLEDL